MKKLGIMWVIFGLLGTIFVSVGLPIAETGERLALKMEIKPLVDFSCLANSDRGISDGDYSCLDIDEDPIDEQNKDMASYYRMLGSLGVPLFILGWILLALSGFGYIKKKRDSRMAI